MEDGRAAGVRLRSRHQAGSSGEAEDEANGAVSEDKRGKRQGSSSSGGGSGGGGEVVRARRGVVSNASVWDTQRLLPPGTGPAIWRERSEATPQVGRCCCGAPVWAPAGWGDAGLRAEGGEGGHCCFPSVTGAVVRAALMLTTSCTLPLPLLRNGGCSDDDDSGELVTLPPPPPPLFAPFFID